MQPADLFADRPIAQAAFERVRFVLQSLGPVEVRTSKSQVVFRRSRGFAYLWLPGQYLRKPDAEVVLSFALGRHDPSQRFKEVVLVSPRHWMHHLEIHGVDDVDEEVSRWLQEAAERAS